MVAHTPVRTDAAVIALVGMAHATSHLFHLLLPPLFPLLMPDFGFGYTEAGFLMAVFFTISGVGQAFAAIVVDRERHQAIVIGQGGESLKRIASEARRDMERLFDSKVYLEVWVKVKSGWNDDERLLKSLGYE